MLKVFTPLVLSLLLPLVSFALELKPSVDLKGQNLRAASPDGSVLLVQNGDRNKELQLVNGITGEALSAPKAITYWIDKAEIDFRNKRLLIVTAHESVKLFSIPEFQEIAGVDLFNEGGYRRMSYDFDAAFAPNRPEMVISPNDLDDLRVYDTDSGKLLRKLSLSRGAVKVSYSADGRSISGRFLGNVKSWEAQTGRSQGFGTSIPAGSWRDQLSPDHSLVSYTYTQFGLYQGAPDKRFVVIANRNGDRLFEINQKDLPQKECYDTDWVAPAFGSDGKTFVIYCTKSPNFFLGKIAANGAKVEDLKYVVDQKGAVGSVSFDPTGKLFLTTDSETDAVQIRDVADGKTLAQLDKNWSYLTEVKFLADGRLYISGLKNKKSLSGIYSLK